MSEPIASMRCPACAGIILVTLSLGVQVIEQDKPAYHLVHLKAEPHHCPGPRDPGPGDRVA